MTNPPPEQPLEARCDHCRQNRPLFLYEPDHDMHLTGITCEWCARGRQPLLCARCWSVEKAREEADPGDPADNEAAAVFVQLVRNNHRHITRREADKAACDGIEAATRAAESGDAS
ncbi:hypothetical protein [Streptomyces sp. Z26]|uniref:hypothetical protein n=1 Tax=Streptomyces sp. Z26 TaxID=2500177 RepID=UPI000EF15312|nr:hypothetical protein [Streptomyces sp. Z26]RLL66965.1 hypothetical protein D7M15_08900 [Streptomyces sp. Z26]